MFIKASGKMNQSIYYKGEEVSDTYLQSEIFQMSSTLKDRKIGYKDIVVCLSDTSIGTYEQWKVCEELGILPIFAFSEFSVENIKRLWELIEFKAIFEIKKGKVYLHVYSDKKETFRFLDIEDGSVIHMTSATTGIPKLVLRTKTQLDAELNRYSKYLKINGKDVILPIVPISHSFGFISGMLLSMKVNAKLVLPDVLLPRNIIQLGNESKATIMLGLPYFYKKMLSVSDKYKLGEELRLIIASGGPMEQELQNDFQGRFRKKILQQYGSSETGSLCIGFFPDDCRCVGKPIPGVEADIIKDEWNRPCLYISSEETIGSYISKDKVEKISETWYKTGDLGEINRDGTIRVLGRCDDILIVDGKKVDKKYVSSVITQINGISAAEIYLSKESIVTELVCEYSGTVKLSKGEFVNHCKKTLAEYQIPKNYIKVNVIKKKKTWKEK